MEYYSTIKKNWTIAIAATWMDLENIMLRETFRERQVLYDITYMWNLKNESIYKTETDSQTENKLMVTNGGGWGQIRSTGLTDTNYYP